MAETTESKPVYGRKKLDAAQHARQAERKQAQGREATIYGKRKGIGAKRAAVAAATSTSTPPKSTRSVVADPVVELLLEKLAAKPQLAGIVLTNEAKRKDGPRAPVLDAIAGIENAREGGPRKDVLKKLTAARLNVPDAP